VEIISFIDLYPLYLPPQYPMGVSWMDGLAGLDYVGELLITPGVALRIVGNIYTVGLIIKTIGIDAHILIDLQAFN